jgi:heavy metal sensor kinase
MRALSIRLRLTAWYSLILALSLGVFGSVAYFAMSHSIRSAVDAGLKRRVEGIRNIIAKSAPQGLPALKDELTEYDEGQGSGSRLRVVDGGSDLLYASPGTGPLSPAEGGAKNSDLFYTNIHGDEFRVLRTTIEANGKRYAVEVATYTEDFDRAIDRFRKLLYAAAPIFLALAALGGYWMSRRALAPVDEIIRAARSIGVTSLSGRLAVPPTGDELERLANTLNEMLARLEASFHRITRFTADASHELRTPVSVMRTNAEITLRKPRTESEYRDALSQILVESEKVSHLIEQLLDLARADSGSAAFSMVRTNLNDALDKACRQASVLAEAKQLRVTTHLPAAPTWIQGDPTALERLFLIFLDNAVKFTPPGGEIAVQLAANDGAAVTEIRDSGIGISAADIPHIFERFYQADRSRSRDNGGSGLGLAIGRWIAQTHGGDVAVESEPSKGSCFQVRLPLS